MRTETFDLARAARIAALTLIVFAGIGGLVHNLAGANYGYDFRGVFDAAHAMLNGANPYAGNTAHALLVKDNPYVLPPLIGELAIPLIALPYWAAVAIFNLLSVAAMVGALRLIGVRDPRVYAVALYSLPFIDSLWLGQPDGMFAVALAFAWHRRDSNASAVAVGFVIAAKLLLWPLLAWLLLTRRYKAAIVATATASAILIGSWALIGFDGMSGYLHRLSIDGKAFDGRSHSFAAAAIHLGATNATGVLAGAVIGVALAVAVFMSSGSADLGAFTAALVAGLLASPLLWTHYLAVLYIPLAVARRRLDSWWLLAAAFVLSPVEPVAQVWQILLVPALGTVLALGAVRRVSEAGDAIS